MLRKRSEEEGRREGGMTVRVEHGESYELLLILVPWVMVLASFAGCYKREKLCKRYTASLLFYNFLLI